MTAQLLPKTVLDAYDVGQLLGAGGHGVAYRAIDRSTGDAVAIKVLHRSLDSPTEVRAFVDETAAMKRLRGHREVVQLFDAFVADDRPVLVMELLDSTLSDRVASLGPLDVHETRAIARELLAATEVVHRSGVVHGDITPSNIFLRSDGELVLADFGVARVADITISGGAGVSLGYVAPETVEIGETSTAADLYAVGATLYSLLAGHPPFVESAETAIPIGVLVRRITDPEGPELPPGTPDDLRELITSLMQQEPHDRPRSAASALAVLNDSSQMQPRVQRARSSRRPVALFLLAGAVLILTAIAAALVTANNTSSTAVDEVPGQLRGVSNAAEADITSTPTTTPALIPSIAPTSEPAPEPSSPDATPPSSSDCSGTSTHDLLCETFENLDGWLRQIDPSVARISSEPVTDALGGAVLRQTPGSGTEPGGSFLERSLGALPAGDDLHVRVEMTFGDLPTARTSERAWFQNVFVVTDELRRTWSVNVQADEAGDLLFHGAYGDPANDQYGGAPITSRALTGESICLLLALPVGSGGAATYAVNDRPMEFPDQEAQQYGSAFVLQIGPSWLEAQELAPIVSIDRVVASTQVLSCSV